MEINNSQLKNQLQKLQSYNIILEKDKNTLIEDKRYYLITLIILIYIFIFILII